MFPVQLLDSIIYLFLAWYLYEITPSKHGLSKPVNFLWQQWFPHYVSSSSSSSSSNSSSSSSSSGGDGRSRIYHSYEPIVSHNQTPLPYDASDTFNPILSSSHRPTQFNSNNDNNNNNDNTTSSNSDNNSTRIDIDITPTHATVIEPYSTRSPQSLPSPSAFFQSPYVSTIADPANSSSSSNNNNNNNSISNNNNNNNNNNIINTFHTSHNNISSSISGNTVYASEPINPNLLLNPEPTVKITALRKTFDMKLVVNHLSLDLYENQIFALLGKCDWHWWVRVGVGYRCGIL
jgi:hypothetical protein